MNKVLLHTPVAVSYTHLDVYKRQHDYLKEHNEIYREVYLQQTNDNADFDKNGGEE